MKKYWKYIIGSSIALTVIIIDLITKILAISLLDYNFYNSNYPRVVIFSDKNVVETFLIKCDGFDCSKYESIK